MKTAYDLSFLVNLTKGTNYALYVAMLFILTSALSVASFGTLALMASKAPEGYETEHGLRLFRRLPSVRRHNTVKSLVSAAPAHRGV